MTKTDDEFEILKKGHGRKSDQKLKPYLVLQYLLKNSDENNVISAPQIVGYLQETCGIYAERRSIYRDIEEINKAMLMVENNIDIFEAEEMLADDIYNEEKFIVYDSDNNFFLRIYFWTYKCRAKNRNLDKYISSYLFYC